MMYNFDKKTNRQNTCSLKHDFAKERGKADDLIPLWVADMDFEVPNEVKQAIESRAQHGIYGYSDPKGSYYEAVLAWFQSRYHWTIQADWIVLIPGVVVALFAAVRAFTKEHDAVLIQTPVYYPFYDCIEESNRTLVTNSLVQKDGKYIIDFDDFEQKIIDNDVKLFILCSPHNPVGRVWTKEELRTMHEICKKHNVMIVSDEIHADFIYRGYEHTPISKLCDDPTIITLTAPSKTFNLAGLQIANAIIPSATLRTRFEKEISRIGYSQLNCFSFVACEAAYRYGAEWLTELLDYLEGNVDYVDSFLRENIPEIKMIRPEGTYLLWLDFTAFGLDDKELQTIIERNAKLWLNAGSIFGEEGKGFQRMNIATQRSVLETALHNLKQAFSAKK